VDALIERAHRLRRRGEDRKAIGLLRQACLLDEWRPRPFAMLGKWLLDAGAAAEARERLRHARWLLDRAGEAARARSLAGLLAAADARAA
jgi:hypothetical protein